MFELRVRPDRLPTGVGVATLALDGKGPVGISDFGLRAARSRPWVGSRLLERPPRKRGNEHGNCGN
jgi:hypothetical protein